ncbi:MAG: hypothetical protein R3F34_00560 [Planctomycetota bacterium]
MYRRARPGRDESHYLRVGRAGVVGFGALLAVFALACIEMRGGQDLISFALGVMTFAYSGLVGVFLCVLLLGRGSARSVIAALLVGFAIVWALQPWFVTVLFGAAPAGASFAELPLPHRIAAFDFTWKFTFAVAVTTVVCALGGRARPEAVHA